MNALVYVLIFLEKSDLKVDAHTKYEARGDIYCHHTALNARIFNAAWNLGAKQKWVEDRRMSSDMRMNKLWLDKTEQSDSVIIAHKTIGTCKWCTEQLLLINYINWYNSHLSKKGKNNTLTLAIQKCLYNLRPTSRITATFQDLKLNQDS